MLRALSEAGIRSDLVVGTSIGAVNGAFIAADPDGAAERLADLWQGENSSRRSARRLAPAGPAGPVRHPPACDRAAGRMLADRLPGGLRGSELPFQCVAASIEHATARWFTTGPLCPR